MTAERLIAALDENPMERLRIAAMLASEQSGRGEDGEAECVNSAFDAARFDDLGRRKGQNSG